MASLISDHASKVYKDTVDCINSILFAFKGAGTVVKV